MPKAGQDINERWSELLARGQDGDRAAYEQVLREMARMLRAYLSSRVRPASEVEDVVQEVLIGVHNARRTYDRSKPIMPWLFAIAHHKIVDHVRRSARNRRVASESYDEDVNAAGRAGTQDEIEAAQWLTQALSALPEGQKRAIELLKLDGLSVTDAASKLKMSPSALKVAAHRGYKALKRNLMS